MNGVWNDHCQFANAISLISLFTSSDYDVGWSRDTWNKQTEGRMLWIDAYTVSC